MGCGYVGYSIVAIKVRRELGIGWLLQVGIPAGSTLK